MQVAGGNSLCGLLVSCQGCCQVISSKSMYIPLCQGSPLQPSQPPHYTADMAPRGYQLIHSLLHSLRKVPILYLYHKVELL